MAIANGGSLRAPIKVGPITVENAVFVAPFRNTVDMIEVTGQTMLSMFEFCAEKWSEDFSDTFAGFLQVSGMQVTYDIRRPVGKRVVEVLVTCTQCDVPRLEPLKKDSVYKILAASFIIGGGDGFSMLPSNIIKRYNLGSLDTDILINYIKKNSPITTGLQGRIRHLKDIEGGLDLKCLGNAARGHLSSIVLILVALGSWIFREM
ncbi:unnamed protein product [Lymnaea stagnalis]|uniref:5'-nucleotidase n=1 Tax=Lymnaea stagnalis TaxID=6523 RepID=A0AAV2HLM6_LYMST